jgi:GNAT superfamily N-acetyltransferase
MNETLSIHLRPAEPQKDFPRMAELMNLTEPEPITVEEMVGWLRDAPKERIQQRMVALDEQGQLVGFSNTGRNPWMTPGRFWIEVVTDPAVSQRGVGSQLYADGVQFARDHGATLLEAEVRDHLPDALHFAQQRGFQLDRHIFESTLDLATFDEERFAGVIESVEASGIRFFSLADLGNTEEAQRSMRSIAAMLSIFQAGSQPLRPLNSSRERFSRLNGIARRASLWLLIESGGLV